jgi:hypothetical protein
VVIVVVSAICLAFKHYESEYRNTVEPEASTLRPVRQPLLQTGEGSIGVFRSAGSDVGKAAHRVIE